MARQQTRKERYRRLRDLGFTAKEASRYRDRSTPAINQFVNRRRATLAKKSSRTEAQESQFQRLRGESDRTDTFRPSRVETNRDRLANFKRWSKSKAFPAQYEDWISDINTANGKDPLDSYGYRIFYYRYVKGLGDAEAIRMVESRDT